MKKDEYAYVLDFLPKGKAEMPPYKRIPIGQVIGETFFSLLEVSPKEGLTLENGSRVYIGEDDRELVDHIERRIKYEWLTPTAKSELPYVLEQIVNDHEGKYVEFYNTAGSISTRQHKLEILPKIGKKHRSQIIEEREIDPFESFEDMRERLKNIDPVRGIVDKIMKEFKGESKYHLFVPLVEKDSKHYR